MLCLVVVVDSESAEFVETVNSFSCAETNDDMLLNELYVEGSLRLKWGRNFPGA